MKDCCVAKLKRLMDTFCCSKMAEHLSTVAEKNKAWEQLISLLVTVDVIRFFHTITTLIR